MMAIPRGATMKNNPDPVGRLGLLASGSSRRWDVAVDESVDTGEWSLEIEGGQTYLVFQLQDLETIPQALNFLQTGLQRYPKAGRPTGSVDEDTLTLGR